MNPTEEPLRDELDSEGKRQERVVIGDTHGLVGDLLKIALTLEGTCRLVGQAALGTDLLALCRAEKPDIVILDPRLPDLPGTEILQRIQKDHSRVRVILTCSANCRHHLRAVLETRPHGFLHKSEGLGVFHEVLRAVVGGSCHISRYGASVMERDGAGAARPAAALSKQEHAVLTLLAHGRSSKEMAHEMSLATKTIEHYRAALMRKLGIHDIASLTRYAVNAGMVGPAD